MDAFLSLKLIPNVVQPDAFAMLKAGHLVMQLEGRSTQWRDTANQAQLPHILTFQRLYFPYHSVQGLKIGKNPILNALHNLSSTAKGEAVRFECQPRLGKFADGNRSLSHDCREWAIRLIGGSMTSKRRALKLKISSLNDFIKAFKGPTTFKISCITWDGCMSKKNPWANTRYSSRLVLVATPLELRLRATNPWELISH